MHDQALLQVHSYGLNVSINGDRRTGRFHDPPTRYGPGYPERSPLRPRLMECRWAGRVRCVETGTGMSATSFGPMSHSKDIGYILSRGEGDATFGSSRGSAVWLEERETREPSSFARFSSLRRKKAPPPSRSLRMTNSFGQWPRVGCHETPEESIYLLRRRNIFKPRSEPMEIFQFGKSILS